MIITCLLLGPAPFLNIKTNVGLIEGIAGLGGVGYALVMVSTFSRAQSEVIGKGFSDDIETYLMISGRPTLNKPHIQLSEVYLFLNIYVKLSYNFQDCGHRLFTWEVFLVHPLQDFWLMLMGSNGQQ